MNSLSKLKAGWKHLNSYCSSQSVFVSSPIRYSQDAKWGGNPFSRFDSLRHAWTDSKGYVHFEGKGRYASSLTNRGKYIAGGLFVSAGLYYIWSLETVPYSQRRHAIMFVSNSQERSLGDLIFKEQLDLARFEHALYPYSHPYTHRVRRIGEKIAKVASDGFGGGSWSHMKDMQWEFAVIRNSAPNAFVVPGGKVVVYSGLLELLGKNDDEVAAVLAHEVAHILARHQAERLSTMNIWGLLGFLTRLLLGLPIPGLAVYLGIFLPYSRLAEHEADSIGLRLMSRACYNPSAASSMLAKLNHCEKELEHSGFSSRAPPLLATHPLTGDRVEKIKEQLPDAYTMYHDSGCYAKREVFQQGAGFFSPSF